MSTYQIRKRVEKVEEALCPNHEPGTYSLETLCRLLWSEDKPGYLKMMAEGDGAGNMLRFFREQFEREDAELEESQS